MKKYSQDFKDYARRMREIRLLSTPDLRDIQSADDYSRVLVNNFSRIGELAEENRKLIDAYIKPLIVSEAIVTDQMRHQLEFFLRLLVKDSSFEEVDVHLSDFLNDHFFIEEIQEAKSSDENTHVIAMAKKVKRDYLLVSALTRYYNTEIDTIRTKAIENRNALACYLKKENFALLNDKAKGDALQYSLMGALLYENILNVMPEDYWQPCLDILAQATSILNDPFYRENLPGYDWNSYEFRIYYYGSFLAYSLLPERIAKEAYAYAQKAVDFLSHCTNEAILLTVGIEQEQSLLYMASVQARYTPAREACDFFYRAFEERNKNDHSFIGIDQNLDTASSYLNVAKIMKLELTEKDYDRFYEIEKSTLDYLYHVPKSSDKYLKCITLFINLPTYFQEVPNAMTMEEFCVSAFAAIHPPTYVHINMVARFAECMTRHLLQGRPELFIGFPGCTTVEQVNAAKDRIIYYAYHSALCHDIGKMFIIDTISMYGRNLLDDEFSIIKNHPVIGATIAMEHPSTREYVDVIKGHHIWHDCSRGYPSGFDTFKSPYKTIIDIVLVADCLDAATDTVGRSYSKGKTLDDFEKEIQEGSGTHYAMFIVDLFKQPGFREDITYLLSEGRQKLYCETFRLLKRNEA